MKNLLFLILATGVHSSGVAATPKDWVDEKSAETFPKVPGPDYNQAYSIAPVPDKYTGKLQELPLIVMCYGLGRVHPWLSKPVGSVMVLK